MAHAQKLLAAEVCASAVVMLDTPRSEVVWRVLATHSIRQFPFHFSSRASPCVITFQLESTHRLRGPERQCGRSEADENTVVKHKLERWSVSTPGHSRFWLRRSWLAVAKSVCTDTNFGMPRRGVMKIRMGSYLFTLGTRRRGPAMDAGAHPPSCRQWLVFCLSLSLSLSLSALERLLGKHWTTTWSYQHTCLRYFDFNIRGAQLWAASPSFEIQCNEKSNIIYI